MQKKFHELRAFLKTDIWRIRVRELPHPKSFWIRQLRILLLAIRAFDENKCQLRASGLTFYTILSIVPIVALAFGIAQGFGVESIFEKQLYSNLYAQKEVVQMILEFAQAMLKNTKGGLIAGIGIGVLFWTVIQVLTHIEEAFNEIWGVKKGRSLGRKFADYLAIMFICPVLFIFSSSLTLLLSSQLEVIDEKMIQIGFYHPAIHLILGLISCWMIWFLLTFLYMIMPNTRVRMKAGISGAVVSGTVYQLMQLVYLDFQMRVSSYGAVYGSFAALPLFLVWLQIGWILILFGAEISFAFQNEETFEFEPDCLKSSLRFRYLLALEITRLCVKKFLNAEQPLTSDQISRQLGVPIRLTNQVIFDLNATGILSEVRLLDGKTFAFQPGRHVDELSVCGVIDELVNFGNDEIPLADTPQLQTIHRNLKVLRKKVLESRENVLLKDI